MLYTDLVTVLPKVGTQRQKQLGRLGIVTVGDLLYHFPRRYLDLTQETPLLDAPLDLPVPIRATVERLGQVGRVSRQLTVQRVLAKSQDGGTLELVFFNNIYVAQKLHPGETYLFYGRLTYQSTQRRSMSSPQIFPGDTVTAGIPVYKMTAGITETILRELVRSALPAAHQLPEMIPSEVRQTYDLAEVGMAIEHIHNPKSPQSLAAAKKRLMFEELFILATSMGMLRQQGRKASGEALSGDMTLQQFFQRLPFPLTRAQQRCIREILSDMAQPVPANRLLQGDVGSGKTMVAAAAAYYAFTASAQSALMVPTELLARQHFQTMERLLSPLGVQVELLTGTLRKGTRKALLERLSAGKTHLLVGTHALFSQDVHFSRLGLVITDEQHRFGVSQREALRRKGGVPHTLVMSATPIPRTLALMLYGELALSVLDEMPPGRQKIRTYRADDSLRERVYRFIQKELDAGRQAYVVCPLVEHTQESDPGLCAATQLYGELSQGIFSRYRLGLLHGKMKPEEKDEVMKEFLQGKIQMLISTTVVEVGVDVPNATVIAVENAERFGLSQLHQLRGRVGRGSSQSYCILLSNAKQPQARERISFMCHTDNGFHLAEYDLQSRGPGNFLGQEQHGLPQLRLADLATDSTLVDEARIAAHSILHKDPDLTHHPQLQQAVFKVMEVVGQRPN